MGEIKLFPKIFLAALTADCMIKLLWMFGLIWVPIIWWAGTIVVAGLAVVMSVAPSLKKSVDELRKSKPMVKSFVPVWVVASIVSVFIHSPV